MSDASFVIAMYCHFDTCILLLSMNTISQVHLTFENVSVIRPLLISMDEQLGLIVVSLENQWCSHGQCTEEDEKVIQAIVKNIKKSDHRFRWFYF